MPRKQRIEYPGAIYHVISRGNYRKELFLKANTGEAFERCLFEVVERCGWKLLGLVDYVHLNPVRAKICSFRELKAYALSSY
ncbi:hypothetical protein QEH52_19855, partial [Coraliomargarita sp. SDUM461003]